MLSTIPARRGSAVLIAATVGVLGATLTAPAAHAAQAPTPSARQAHAKSVLAGAEAVFTSKKPTRDATVALRDLALSLKDLKGRDLTKAKSILARPDASAEECNTDICVHYSTTGIDAVDTTDANSNTFPDYVDTTLATVQHVRDTYIAAGYRTPKSDLASASNGGNGKFDVYLKETGPSVYGYCTVDDDGVPADGGPQDTWSYCALDNDFSPAEFPTNTPVENLQVTAAHEYFHATQYAYDFSDDRWLLEATATWAEDEVYDDVNDNLQYLTDGPLGRPSTPLDYYSSNSSHQYGDWIFFRYLTERYPATTGSLPNLILHIWQKAGAATGDQDLYSLQAVSSALDDEGTDLPTTLAQFADANLRPDSVYAESSAEDYPTAPTARQVTLSPSATSSHVITTTVNHLASKTTRFTPSHTSSAYKLKIAVNMSRPGATAIVTVKLKSGTTSTHQVALDSSHDGYKIVGFSSSAVKYVTLTLVNASERFTCNTDTNYSCHGTSKDDSAVEKYSGRAYK